MKSRVPAKNITHPDAEILSEALNLSFLLKYEEVFSEDQWATLDTLTTSICRLPLSGFPQAVERRYSPVTGMPIGSSVPVDVERLLPSPETEQLYEQFMSSEEVAETARIQPLENRARTHQDWAYLAEQRNVLLNLLQRQQHRWALFQVYPPAPLEEENR